MDQKLVVWDLQHSSPRSTCEHEEGVTCLSWLGSSRYLATGSVDGKVRLWDSLSGDCVRTFSGHHNAIQSLAVSANGDFLVSVSLDTTARVFEIAEFSYACHQGLLVVVGVMEMARVRRGSWWKFFKEQEPAIWLKEILHENMGTPAVRRRQGGWSRRRRGRRKRGGR
ncbi:hypothetical protein M9H77_24242 [Catharanthus roseus]|uniref:Uncharacterized protein n=1 Tax=Catharanthus roseus TaxID=4058 RepID=A0ACC0AXR3_CATRO|nr:hypothetical protein M9H77_24242 [Catharanthus roseus]